jgi:hypothetical protein
MKDLLHVLTELGSRTSQMTSFPSIARQNLSAEVLQPLSQSDTPSTEVCEENDSIVIVSTASVTTAALHRAVLNNVLFTRTLECGYTFLRFICIILILLLM